MGGGQVEEVTLVPGVNISQIAYCDAANFLPREGDLEIKRNSNNSRPFSIRRQDFEPTHSNVCTTSDDMLQAVARGQRRWDEKNLTLLQKEQHPSSFIPHQCSIPYYPPDQVCEVLDRFFHVIIQGDLLSRHLQCGLLMSLRGDFVRGSSVSSRKQEMNKCLCDAQFSKNHRCRLNDYKLYNRFQSHQLGLCPNFNPNLDDSSQQSQQPQPQPAREPFKSVFNINRLKRVVYKFHGVNCTFPDSQGILVIVQRGIHMKFDGATTNYSWIGRPIGADKKSIYRRTRSVMTITRQPLESSRQGEFRSGGSIFL